MPAFVVALRRTFYLDEDAIRAAIGQRSSFNVVHLGRGSRRAKAVLVYTRDRVSDRQWGDAVGVLKVAADRLDFVYLRHVCALLNVEALLARARAEASKTR